MTDIVQSPAAVPENDLTQTPDLPNIEGLFAWVVVAQTPQGRTINIPVISFRHPNGAVTPQPLVCCNRQQAENMRQHAQMLANQCNAEVRLVSCSESTWEDCVLPQRIAVASAIPSLLQAPVGPKAPR